MWLEGANKLETELPEEQPQLWWSREGQAAGQMEEPSQNSEGTLGLQGSNQKGGKNLCRIPKVPAPWPYQLLPT